MSQDVKIERFTSSQIEKPLPHPHDAVAFEAGAAAALDADAQYGAVTSTLRTSPMRAARSLMVTLFIPGDSHPISRPGIGRHLGSASSRNSRTSR
jgi:hypothetical protein